MRLAMSQQRPPSVITPDESDSMRTAGPSSLTAAPSSLVSASDMFSPGQLMTPLPDAHARAHDARPLAGTLNELGNMLPSPGVTLRRGRATPPPSRWWPRRSHRRLTGFTADTP